MGLIRHCDMCNKALDRNSIYISVELKHDGDDGGIVVGLPFVIEGDYCSMNCLKTRIKQLMEI